MKCFGERAGVQLDELRSYPGGSFDLLWVGSDEQTHLDTRVVETAARFAQSALLADRVESAFGRDLLAAFGDETDDIGLKLERDGEDFGRVGHFQV